MSGLVISVLDSPLVISIRRLNSFLFVFFPSSDPSFLIRPENFFPRALNDLLCKFIFAGLR